MEPLVSSEPGPPVYLTKRINAAQRAQYAAGLKAARAQFEKLQSGLRNNQRLAFILRAIDNVQKDLASA
jgi:hypothetical protein